MKSSDKSISDLSGKNKDTSQSFKRPQYCILMPRFSEAERRDKYKLFRAWRTANGIPEQFKVRRDADKAAARAQTEFGVVFDVLEAEDGLV
jgi:hypothetical protein